MNCRTLGLALCGILVAGVVISPNALAVVVFSEDFENGTNPSTFNIGGTVFTSSGTNVNGTSTVQIATDNLGPDPVPLFSNGTKYMQFSDQSSTLRTLVSVSLPVDPVDPENAPNLKQISNSGFYWSFDYYEPSGFGPSSTRIFLSNGSATSSGERLVELALIDQANAAGYYAPGFTLFDGITGLLPIDTKHHIEVMGIIGNVEGGSISYLEGVESVADNTFDLWINGTKIGDNAGFRNAIEGAAIKTFGISGTAGSATETAYFDNIVLRTDLPGAAVSLAGDHNGDTVVNAADYAFWRDTMGDLPRYNDWLADFGAGGGGGAVSQAVVPEPGVSGLLATALATLTCAAFRRRAE